MESSTPLESRWGGTPKPPRQRVITTCLTCRRRKVKCDHKQPVCSTCQRGNHVCLYAKPQPDLPVQPRAATARVSRSNRRTGQDEIRNRLDRLEKLLERAIAGGEGIPQPSEVQNMVSETTSRPCQRIGGGSVTPTCETLSGDGYDGALLLGSESGQSRWVSSLHYALLADEIHDVKMLLSDQASDSTTRKLSSEESDSPFLFSTSSVENLAPWLPTSADDCFLLLEIFYSNVDPMTRLIHKPSLGHRFTKYIQQAYDKKGRDIRGVLDISLSTFEPLALAIFYSAVNSMSPESVIAEFSQEKEIILSQYRRGVELGLGREGFLTTASIEVLQAFVLLLTCQSREDDMSKTWSLLGLVIRIALSQGLHREPSLFPSDNMNDVQVELRRRLWHQICYLDFRSAESKGQEPTISDDDFTTLLPRNVNDEALAEGTSPTAGAYPVTGFTDMTGHLVRLHGIHCFRKIIRSTYRWERQSKSAIPGSGSLYPIIGLQSLFNEVQTMVNEMTTYLQTQYLEYCDPRIPEQRLALGLAEMIEWRCWSVFWLRMPKQYREAVVSPEIRTMVMNKSVSLVEGMNQMPDNKDAERFQWHISGHACFQAIMHVISELKTPEFQKWSHHRLRSRAFAALQQTLETRGFESSSTWKVIRRVISNCLAQNSPNCPTLTHTQGTISQPLTDVDSAAASQQSQTNNGAPSAQEDIAELISLPDLESLEALGMQDPSMGFDWTFWNFDLSDLNSY